MDRIRSLLTQSTSPISITSKMEHRSDPGVDYVEPFDRRREQERSDHQEMHLLLEEYGIWSGDYSELLSGDRHGFNRFEKATVTNGIAVEQTLLSSDIEAKFGGYLRMGKSW